MVKLKIYVDTSVIGGCFDDEFSKISNKLFEEFKSGIKIAVISDITLLELKKGYHILEIRSPRDILEVADEE